MSNLTLSPLDINNENFLSKLKLSCINNSIGTFMLSGTGFSNIILISMNQNVSMNYILRDKEELFEETIRREVNKNSYNVVINGPTYKLSTSGKIDALNGSDPVAPEETTILGQIKSNGRVISGVPYNMYHLSYNKDKKPKFKIGKGYSENNATLSIGNIAPLVINKLKYGPKNIYNPSKPNAKVYGEPNEENRKFLVQRSNARFKQIQSSSKRIGKISVLINNTDNLIFILAQKHGSSGMDLASFRDVCLKLNASSAGYFDGSDSVTLAVNGNFLIKSASNKNETNTIGIGFKYE